jgi:hypothetical protein
MAESTDPEGLPQRGDSPTDPFQARDEGAKGEGCPEDTEDTDRGYDIQLRRCTSGVESLVQFNRDGSAVLGSFGHEEASEEERHICEVVSG